MFFNLCLLLILQLLLPFRRNTEIFLLLDDHMTNFKNGLKKRESGRPSLTYKKVIEYDMNTVVEVFILLS